MISGAAYVAASDEWVIAEAASDPAGWPTTSWPAVQRGSRQAYDLVLCRIQSASRAIRSEPRAPAQSQRMAIVAGEPSLFHAAILAAGGREGAAHGSRRIVAHGANRRGRSVPERGRFEKLLRRQAEEVHSLEAQPLRGVACENRGPMFSHLPRNGKLQRTGW